MQSPRFPIPLLPLGLGLTLSMVIFELVGLAAPANPILSPLPNSHTAPLTSAVSIAYDEAISPATVTSRTFAVHAMQSGLVTATHTVSGGTISVTPTRPFHQGELVYAIATTRTLSITGTEPISSTQWTFQAGRVFDRDFGRFRDIEAGLTGVEASSVAWGDHDGDGDLDILLTGWDQAQYPVGLIYSNDNGSFDQDSVSWLIAVSHGSSAWGDYDNDGDLDVLLTGYRGTGSYVAPPASLIFRNDAGHFTDIGAGLVAVSHGSSAWGDYDNDGDLDILLTGYTEGGPRISLVYRNDAGIFTDIGAGLEGVGTGSVAWGDYDNDGDLDILLTGYTTGGTHTSLIYRNDAGIFTDIGAGLVGVIESSVAWGDYDNDGDLDILLTGCGAPTTSRVSLIYRNDAGTFTDAGAGLEGVCGGSAAWGDYDNDGDLDILLTGDALWHPESLVYRNDSGSFTNIETALIDVYVGSAAWGDYDNDGDLDILLTGRPAGMPPSPISLIYRNEDDASDLMLSKKVLQRAAAAGDAITYTLTFLNDGMRTATQVVITDTLPGEVLVNGITSSGVAITNTAAGPEYIWQVADLPADAGGVITITGVLSTAPLSGTITNTATISTATVDSNPYNNHSDATLDVYAWRILDTLPAPNAGGVPLTQSVVVTFSNDLLPSTATRANFVVQGMFGGRIGGSFDYDASGRILTYTLDRPLFAGEIVRTTATSRMLRFDGGALLPYQWQFQAGPVKPARCFSGFTDTPIGLPPIGDSTADWGDYDNDGRLDLLYAGWGEAALYHNDGETFTRCNIGLSPEPAAGAWGDYDNDGDPDILLVQYRRTRLYRNENSGCSFTEVNAGLAGVDFGSAAWGDYDNDGDLDILLAGYVGSNGVVKVYRNDNGVFADIGAELVGTTSTSAAWGDYDNDGDLDILLTDSTEFSSLVYRNDKGKFTPVDSGLLNGVAGPVAWGDYDGDGDLDALLTWGTTTNYAGATAVYRNDAGRFTDIGAGLPNVYGGQVAWGDYDNDGDLDILLTGRPSTSSNSAISRVYRNDSGSFVDINAGLVGVSIGEVAWGDYDNDGDLDILLTGYNANWSRETRLYRNDDCPLPGLSAAKWAVEMATIGDTITYTYRVTNTGNVNLTGLVAGDSPLGAISLDKNSLVPGQAASSILTYTVVEDDLPGPLTNTVIVTGTYLTDTVTATTQASVALTYSAALTLSKTANVETAGVGETITYTYRITNTGSVSLTNLVASDTPLGAIYLDKDSLTPGQDTTGTLTYTVVEDDLPGPLTNTVIASGTLFNSSKITNTASISVALSENSSGDHIHLPIILKND